ncbi:glycosyltransferase family 2 protein [Demequina salsinemoris]|uniref:glycosyltransferase family 2 protein n=1 Tax=Demequina salsinemoris TaxID=577470 RepID=UPI00128CDEF9|nr:hypothetical protein [Demequina salsinemoris]
MGIVVSTLGRLVPLGRLLDSLSDQVRDGDRIVIVAQGGSERLVELVRRYERRGLPVFTVESARGVSLGRNTGARALADSVDVLHFPNDTSWYADGLVNHIRAAVDSSELAALTPMGGEKPRACLPEPGIPLNRYNAWDVIEIGLVIRAKTFLELGGFDETLGSGASTPWQAGEGSDLVLRALERLGEHCLTWLPSTVVLGGIAEADGLTADERRRKLRAYNRGIAVVVRRWRYPTPWIAAFVAGGLAWSIRHPGYALWDGWSVFIGRVEGIFGRVFDDAPFRAVDR